jgi:hypothetical protein
MKMVQSGAGRCGNLSSAPFEAEEKLICEDDIIYPKVENRANIMLTWFSMPLILVLIHHFPYIFFEI